MSEETVKALTQPSFDKLHSMFDLAWECNKSDETRTNLSRMVTDYITHVMQDYSWLIGIVEDISDDRLRELAAAEREGRVVVRPFKNGQIVFVINEGEIYKCTVDYCGNDCIAISHKKYYSSFDDEFVPYICKVISDTEKEPPTFETEAEAAALAAAGKGE